MVYLLSRKQASYDFLARYFAGCNKLPEDATFVGGNATFHVTFDTKMQLLSKMGKKKHLTKYYKYFYNNKIYGII